MYTAIDTIACGYYLFYLTGEDAVSLEEELPKAMPIPRVVTVVKGGQKCTNRSESRLENRLLNMPRTGGGRKAGVGNYSKEEVMDFLGIMEGNWPRRLGTSSRPPFRHISYPASQYFTSSTVRCKKQKLRHFCHASNFRTKKHTSRTLQREITDTWKMRRVSFESCQIET